jgi:drug/metabolite transporter (DMT)-like permease
VTLQDSRAHRRALLLMLVAPLMWSIAGVVTRNLSPEIQAQGRFEITFWRSLFAALCVGLYLAFVQRDFVGAVRRAGRAGMLSGLMWCAMFCCFMLALTLTTVANTLVVMSVAPLVTALLARFVLRTPIAPRTWTAICAASAGMLWMFADSFAVTDARHVLGMLIAFGVPLASAINIVNMKRQRLAVDLVPAVFIGGVLSAALMLPLALPFIADGRDVLLLAVLGFFQLGIPCAMMVVAARHLSATELALLALLEVLFGTLWAWLGAGETPTSATLVGGAVVLAALVFNELAGRRATALA